jgi:hypothetical protein
MKLNPSQIDHLYTFTRQHYVEYYDLQTELVDHLANAIEIEWQENPKLTFEEILHKEFKKFGVFGFMEVVEQRQKALGKKYNRLVWKHFKAFFTLPKALLTCGLMFFVFHFIKMFYFNGIFSLIILILIAFLIPFYIIQSRKIKKRKEEGKKIWLLEQLIFQLGNFSWLISLPFNFVNIFFKSEQMTNDYALLGISFLIVSFYIVSYIITQIIPSKAEEYLKQTYPEYEFEN